MNGVGYHSRRASADDLPQLVLLWQNNALCAVELEKRFTEFQLAEDATGRLVGAIGLRVHQQHGMLHSEAYPDFGLVDTLRPLLWERIRNVAGSNGLVRLWTLESAPYWRQEDFVAADDEMLAKLPEDFGSKENCWHTLKLRDELALDDLLAKEFAVFKKTERARNEQLLQQARFLKGLATLIAFGALVLVAYAIYHLFQRNPPSAP